MSARERCYGKDAREKKKDNWRKTVYWKQEWDKTREEVRKVMTKRKEG